MPFGLCNAQATYQRAIDSALSGTTHSLPYIDDTLTYYSTFEDHLTHLRRVLECYRSSQMQLRREKCRFAYSEIEFLGHLMTPQGYQPHSSLVSKIKDQSHPNNSKELRSFLGLVNYYREFISRMSNLASPLFRQTKEGVSWCWDSSCEESYQLLCKSPAKEPVVLVFPGEASMRILRAFARDAWSVWRIRKRLYSPKQPLSPIKLNYELPRAIIGCDVATLPWTKDGFRYVLIIVHLVAKYMEAVPMRNQTAQSIVQALESGWILRFGYPALNLSDQGPNVDGHLVRHYVSSSVYGNFIPHPTTHKEMARLRGAFIADAKSMYVRRLLYYYIPI